MTQRRRKRRSRFGRRAFLAGAGCAALAGAGLMLRRGQTVSALSVPAPEAEPNAALPAGEWRAVWVSYLEWAGMDFSSEEAFRAGAAALMDNCLSIGLNTVIVQVRPFGDALYRSRLFPWSHVCTGEQGKDPGFDPLDVLITEAHSRGLSLEAWVNPYRLRSSAKMPAVLAESSLANTHPEWVCAVGEGLYLNPAIPEAADYVVQGVAELVQNYAVDGIHFDDYFYPTTDAALDAAQDRLKDWMDRVTLVHSNFDQLDAILDSLGLAGVDGMLFDLGVSSPQLDDSSRGFSYMADAPLDMRMDRSEGLTAADVVNTWSQEELRRILSQYGEERYAASIAAAIVRRRQERPIETTLELVDIIKSGMPARALKEKQHPAKRSFQAIRIAVNDELASVDRMVRAAVPRLNKGGRLAVITFHSLEDRIVKTDLAEFAKGCTCPPDFPVCVCGKTPDVKLVPRKPILPSAKEVEENPRARSAKLRVAEKLKDPKKP